MPDPTPNAIREAGRQRFEAFLKEASENVKTWPKWKQNLLGSSQQIARETAVDACREAFERWAKSHQYETEKYPDGVYRMMATRHAWNGWAAAHKEQGDDGK